MAPRRRIRTRGFTLLEMVVTVVIIGILTGFSAGILSPQISFWRGRTSAQAAVSLLKHAQYLARTTHVDVGDVRVGPLANNNPVPLYGVSIFQPQGQGRGFRFYLWRERDPILDLLRPAAGASFASLGGPGVRLFDDVVTYSLELPMETMLTRQANLVPTAMGNTRIAFLPDGRLDVANSDLANLLEENPFGNQDYRTWSFDIMNPDIGYMRVRIHSDGTVEQSLQAPVGGPLLTQGGGQF